MPTFHHDGAELHYTDEGSGTPVVFLHGLGSSGLDWALQVAHFAPRYRCITFDARGSGGSRDTVRPGGPFSIKQHAADVAALLKHLGAAPAHVVGLSMGGMIGFQLAVDFPALVRSLTNVNSGPEMVVHTSKDKRLVLLRRIVARLFGPKGMAKIVTPKLFPKPEQEALRTQFRERMSQNDKRAYIASQEAIFGWSVRDRIGGITAPVLIVHAEHDYSPLAAKESWMIELRDARLVVVLDTHHALPVEAPEQFNRTLETFLATQPAAALAA